MTTLAESGGKRHKKYDIARISPIAMPHNIATNRPVLSASTQLRASTQKPPHSVTPITLAPIAPCNKPMRLASAVTMYVNGSGR